MRKALLVFLSAALVFLYGPGKAGMLQYEGEEILLVSCEGEPGRADLEISLADPGEAGKEVYLLDPLFNGVEGVFPDEWLSGSIRLQPGERTEWTVSILSDDPDELPETVSFRFCLDGIIFTPVTVSFPDQRCIPGERPEPDGRILLTEVEAPEEIRDTKPEEVSDRLAPEEVPLLDYAQARVCFLKGNVLRLIATLPAEVQESGEAEASFSGFALTLAGRNECPLSVTESREEEGTAWAFDNIGLYSDTVYFALLSGRAGIKEGKVSVTEQTTEAVEFRKAAEVPFELFTNGNVSSLCYLPDPEDREGPADCRPDFDILDMTEPLRLALVPAKELGEIYVFFEYYLTDDRTIIHPAVPLN